MMVQNFELYSDYLHHAFVDYEQQQKPIVNDIPRDIIYAKPNFLDIQTVWNDIQGKLHNNKFYALGIIGTQGTGKTSTCEEFVKIADAAGYKITYAMPEDYFDDLDYWLGQVMLDPRARNCIVLDDQSYAGGAHSNKVQATWKNIVSRFRKLFQGEVFVIYVTHRLHATPPMLRNASTWIFTELNASDQEDMLEVIGKNRTHRDTLSNMQDFLTNMIIEGNKNKDITYEYQNRYFKFKWGNKEDKGDGRLMACLHENIIQIFNAHLTEPDIDLNRYRHIKGDT